MAESDDSGQHAVQKETNKNVRHAHNYSMPKSWPELIYRGIKDFGFSTVLCAVLIYGIFIIGQRLVTAHEQYLIDTSALFKANDQNIHDLNTTEKKQTAALQNLNTNITETQRKSLELHQKQLETLDRIEKSISKK